MVMSRSKKFQPLATSTPNSKSAITESAVCAKHVAEDKDDATWRNKEVKLGEEGTVNRRVFSPGWLLTEEEKLLLFKICNGRPVT